jgi:hypothetical protein
MNWPCPICAVFAHQFCAAYHCDPTVLLCEQMAAAEPYSSDVEDVSQAEESDTEPEVNNQPVRHNAPGAPYFVRTSSLVHNVSAIPFIDLTADCDDDLPDTQPYSDEDDYASDDSLRDFIVPDHAPPSPETEWSDTD